MTTAVRITLIICASVVLMFGSLLAVGLATGGFQDGSTRTCVTIPPPPTPLPF
jgi:hypothetical protein